MAFQPDEETTWSACFAGGFGIPGIKIDLSSFIGRFEYDSVVYNYTSVLGIKRDIEVNPLVLLNLLGGGLAKWAKQLAPTLGNYDLQVSNYAGIMVGSQLSLVRSGIDYKSNKLYAGNEKFIVSIIIMVCMADMAASYYIRYGSKENDSGAKITVGVAHGLNQIALIVLHIAEYFAKETPERLINTIKDVKTITNRLADITIVNTNIPDVLNPLLTAKRISNIQNIVTKCVTNVKELIKKEITVLEASLDTSP